MQVLGGCFIAVEIPGFTLVMLQARYGFLSRCEFRNYYFGQFNF